MGVLERLPAWATTGVGSLPFTEGRRAAAHAVRAYDLPFCPQLPRLEGDMVAEWLGADPRRCGWSPERDGRRPRAWAWLLRELGRRPPAHGLVKLQVTGPLTLAWALGDLSLAPAVGAWLAANVAEQSAALAERGLDALVVVDEPALSALPALREPERAWDPLRTAGAVWGLHLCCAVPWELVDRAAPDVLSFDLAHARVDARGAAALERLAARGGRAALGVLAPHLPETARDAERRLADLGALVPGGQALLTASCGTGRVAPARELELAATLRRLARAARRQASRGRPG